ncbi:hypothetical protein IWQ49_006487, partial [Labrenzia sp. EL_126]|nr:hypothetical protein [Labrenzia sp. EL_126]
MVNEVDSTNLGVFLVDLERSHLSFIRVLELEFPRFDGHFFDFKGECFSCREQETRILRNSG